ncbi:hypothetical protein [Flagellimonas sp. SN16]|uniref:hypothetical protein n=1 Tax=Flagellimonas sp. SN16 TaxID=3415142 RepID=UPI003C4958EC
MDFEELTEYLVQNCFIELEENSVDILEHIHLNFCLCETDEEKMNFLKGELNKRKINLGKQKGLIAASMSQIYTQFEKFSDYKHFYDMLHNLYEDSLVEYISWTIDETKTTIPNNKNIDTTSNAADKYELLNPWILAATDLLAILYLKDDLVRFENTGVYGPNPLAPSKPSSRFLRFNGKRPLNLRERYYFIDRFTELEKNLFTVIKSSEKREEVLAFILHCNPKNAQQILNGTYDAKLRDQEILDYIKSFEKE